jgi:DNA-binding transcriptional ArsR family regulator
MKPVAWTVLGVALLALAGLAAATYDSGSSLDAAAPIVLAGRTDALVPHHVASFVSPDDSTSVLYSLRAPQASVSKYATPSCTSAPTGLIGNPCATQTRPTTVRLADAQVTVTRALSGYKIAVTNDNQYAESNGAFGAPGSLVATAGESTLLGATTKDLYLNPCMSDWADGAQSCAISGYKASALDADVTSQGGALRAIGGSQTLLQGVEVHVTGKQDGQAYDETFQTPITNDGQVQFLVVEATGGDLSATSDAPLVAYGVTTADARGGATMQHATGHVSIDGRGQDYKDQDAVLEGPLSLAVSGVKSTNGATPHLAFAVSSNLHVADLATPPPKHDSTTQLVAAGAAGAGAAALVAGLVYFWPRLKFATTLLALPLYTRIERTAVLEHEKRDEIYELIRASPGIHAHEIGEKANIGWGTTVYHLKLLEQHSLVVSKKSGRYKRFFVNTGEYTKKKDVYGALRNETAKAVADFIVNHPGCNQKELCAALDIQPSLASWHVEKLEGVELVKRVKDGRMVRYFAGPAWTDLNVRILPQGGADTPVET